MIIDLFLQKQEPKKANRLTNVSFFDFKKFYKEMKISPFQQKRTIKLLRF